LGPPNVERAEAEPDGTASFLQAAKKRRRLAEVNTALLKKLDFLFIR